jgi:hypothetical protein
MTLSGIWGYVAAGALGALVAGLAAWYVTNAVMGRTIERERAAHAGDMLAVSTLAAVQLAEARRHETEWRERVSAIQVQHAKDLEDAKRLEDILRADVDAGRRQLHILTVNRPRSDSVSGDPGAPGGSDEIAVELSGTARQTYYSLRGAIIADRATLRACQAYATAVSK